MENITGGDDHHVIILTKKETKTTKTNNNNKKVIVKGDDEKATAISGVKMNSVMNTKNVGGGNANVLGSTNTSGRVLGGGGVGVGVVVATQIPEDTEKEVYVTKCRKLSSKSIPKNIDNNNNNNDDTIMMMAVEPSVVSVVGDDEDYDDDFMYHEYDRTDDDNNNNIDDHFSELSSLSDEMQERQTQVMKQQQQHNLQLLNQQHQQQNKMKLWDRKTSLSKFIKDAYHHQQQQQQANGSCLSTSTSVVIMLYESPLSSYGTSNDVTTNHNNNHCMNPNKNNNSSDDLHMFVNEQTFKVFDGQNNNNNQASNVLVDPTVRNNFKEDYTRRIFTEQQKVSSYESIIDACTYATMNGVCYPMYVSNRSSETLVPYNLLLLEHWNQTIPRFQVPNIIVATKTNSSSSGTTTILKTNPVYSRFPMEKIPFQITNPHIQYHLLGRDVLHLMTKYTPKLLTNTRDHRPCVCKMTHATTKTSSVAQVLTDHGEKWKGVDSMPSTASSFIIRNDEDEKTCHRMLMNNGNPSYVICEYVPNIQKTISCHFFIHPKTSEYDSCYRNMNTYSTVNELKSDLTWFGFTSIDYDLDSKCRNKRIARDISIIDMKEQEVFFSELSSYMDCMKGTGTRMDCVGTRSGTPTTPSVNIKKKDQMARIIHDVVQYFHLRGFGGFCSIEIDMDINNNHYLVGVQPFIDELLPLLMMSSLLHYDKPQVKYQHCVYHTATLVEDDTFGGVHNSSYNIYFGSASQLINHVNDFNQEHENKILIVVLGYVEVAGGGVDMKTSFVDEKNWNNNHSIDGEENGYHSGGRGCRTTLEQVDDDDDEGVAADHMKKTIVKFVVYGHKHNVNECCTILRDFCNTSLLN